MKPQIENTKEYHMIKQGMLALSISTLLLAGCGGGGSNKNDDSTTPPTQSAQINGKYNVVVTPSSSSGQNCGSAAGTYTLTNGKNINGTVTDTNGTVFTVTGIRESNGYVEGGFAFSNGSKSADFSGNINENGSSGTWSDIYGCSGIWVATKTP